MKTIKIPAIRYTQSNHTLYSMVVNARSVPTFAESIPLTRDDQGNLEGFQREKIKAHIKEIKAYLASERPMIPNSLIVGFTKPLRFTPFRDEENTKGSEASRGSELGWLSITQMGAIVDGQQRLEAFEDGPEDFFMNVVAFIAADENELREHMGRVNSSRPLPKSFLYEMMPSIKGIMSSSLEKKRLPIILREHLNRDQDSPLNGMISTPTNPSGNVSGTTVLKMIEESLSGGYLFNLRGESELDDPDTEGMLVVLKNFWAAVAQVFKPAWQAPKNQSTLLQAVGVRSLSSMMDHISDLEDTKKLTKYFYAKELRLIEGVCCWTDGDWNLGANGGKRAWNELENTEKTIKLMKNYLHRMYRIAKKKDGMSEEAVA